MSLHSSQILFELPTPTIGTDPANKSYADSLYTQLLAFIQALDATPSVRVALTTNVNIASPGATLDGVTMVSGDSFAAMSQTTGSQNEVYIWNGASTPATIRPDWAAGNVTANKSFFVDEGTNAGKMYRVNNTGTITVGTTTISFVVAFTQGSAVPTKANKELTVNTTTADGNQATSATVSGSPSANSNVFADVNGLMHTVGDGVKTKHCYFSLDGGTTAATFVNANGATIHWNGSLAGYQLNASKHKLSIHFVN